MSTQRLITSLALALSLGCGGGSDVNAPENPGNPPPPPPPTAKGTPNGQAVTTTIGPEGGTLVSADAGLTLTIPAGAVAQPTEFGIQPVTNEAYNGVGPAYQLTPEGQTFSTPVQVSLGYSDDEIVGTPAAGLGLAYQDGDGRWWGMLSTAVDEAQHRLTVSTTHFSAYAGATFWQFFPKEASARAKGTVNLSVVACVVEYEPIEAAPGEDELASLLPTNDCNPSIRTGKWLVNDVQGGNGTVGTVAAGSPTSQAVFTAPARIPSPRTVTVTGLLTWESRRVTKRFDARVTIISDTVKLHVTGVFDSGTLPGGETAVSSNGGFARVTDKFEADLALNEAQGGATVSGITNDGTQVSGLHGPPDPAGIYCAFTVDGSYEHITVTSGEAFYNPNVGAAKAEASLRVSGTSFVPGGKLGTPTDNGCETLDYPPGTYPNQADLDFDRLLLTEPGKTITIDNLDGWKFTVEWRE